jgi:hypothetical protein
MRFDYREVDSQEKLLGKIAEFFRTQKVMSIKNDICLYRADGVADAEITCVVGAFIPDELYDNLLEGVMISSSNGDPSLATLTSPEFGAWLMQHLPLLVDAQAFHDSLENWTNEGFKTSALDEFLAKYS